MVHSKLQVGCLVLLSYIAIIYIRECRKHHINLKETLFDELLILGIVSVTLDGITAYTVNHLQYVNPFINKMLHAMFLISLDSVIFVLFLYMLNITVVCPKKKSVKVMIYTPFILNVIVVLGFINSLEYIETPITNYSMGISAYTCFVMAAVYIIMTIIVFIGRWRYIESNKRVSIITYLLFLAVITLIQMLIPETLITSLAVTVFIVGVYLNLEDPALKELSHFHNETVMSFANLIETRDDSTGGHIKRTSKYVALIAEELRDNGAYRDILTKDYITNLMKAAPMHDIGKISVPDAVLRKPGKFTDEEYAIMKTHSEKGGDTIREVFRNLGDEDYRRIAFEVARYHHEKWNGKGYPDGLKGEEIPLCARIMAVADVFDAVSEKRCYRDAMPLDKCFAIIEQGSGTDFDPAIVKAFLEIKDKVCIVHKEINENR